MGGNAQQAVKAGHGESFKKGLKFPVGPGLKFHQGINDPENAV